MNLILFTAEEAGGTLPRTDPRAVHLLSVLRRGVGEIFDAGLINGPRGKGRLEAVEPDRLHLSFRWDLPLAPLEPLVLLFGLPRPQTARDLLREATTLGATALHFVTTERCDANYAASSLWSTGEWRRHCLQGAEQAFDTRIPEVSWSQSLESTLGSLPSGGVRVGLDNYEASGALGACEEIRNRKAQPVTMALGPERGWGERDRALLRSEGFLLAHLGTRVLRSETAMVAAVSILRAVRGQM